MKAAVFQVKVQHSTYNCPAPRDIYFFSSLPVLAAASACFFTISGFLIADLLMAQWDAMGTIAMARFELRRAMRATRTLVEARKIGLLPAAS